MDWKGSLWGCGSCDQCQRCCSWLQSSTTSYWTNWLWITNWLISHTKKRTRSMSKPAQLFWMHSWPVDLVVAGSNRRPASRRSVGLVKGRHVCPERRLLVLHNVMFQATSESGKLFDFTLCCRKNRCKMQTIKDEHLYQQYHTHTHTQSERRVLN